jgi:hypothetical protein
VELTPETVAEYVDAWLASLDPEARAELEQLAAESRDTEPMPP